MKYQCVHDSIGKHFSLTVLRFVEYKLTVFAYPKIKMYMILNYLYPIFMIVKYETERVGALYRVDRQDEAWPIGLGADFDRQGHSLTSLALDAFNQRTQGRAEDDVRWRPCACRAGNRTS